MELVQRRDAATLPPIIQQHTLSRTIIWSDDWAACRRVASLPGVSSHEVVNHSLNFIDPITGVQTQGVDSYWNRVKRKFKRMMGVSADHLASHLDEFMWREFYMEKQLAKHLMVSVLTIAHSTLYKETKCIEIIL